MFLSYSYDELIEEIKEDIEDGVLTLNQTIKIVRNAEPVANDYFPIIDYYYMRHKPLANKYSVMTVADVLNEMEKYNNIFNEEF